MPREALDEIKAESQRRGRDLYVMVAATALGIDYGDVMLIERYAAKQGLFTYTYSARAAADIVLESKP